MAQHRHRSERWQDPVRLAMRLLLLAAVGLTAAACVSTNASLLNPSVTYQRTCPNGVQIFTSAERVRSEYYEVAILNSKGESSWTDEHEMTASQRSKAARLGANGIILGDVKEPNAGTKILGSIFGTGAERKGSGLAIYIPADSARVNRICSGKGANAVAYSDQEPVAPKFGVAASAPPEPSVSPPGDRPAPLPPSRQAVLRPAVVRAVPQPATGTVESAPSAETQPDPVQGYAPNGPAEAPLDTPAGTRWVADTEKKVYMPVGCTTFIREMVPENRYYYRTEAAAQADGYMRSDHC
jgi:hypothetical protein